MLPNLDAAVVSPLSPADVLLLERFAERQSEDVWHLSGSKILAAVEEGLAVAELRDFLRANSQADLPQTVPSPMRPSRMRRPYRSRAVTPHRCAV